MEINLHYWFFSFKSESFDSSESDSEPLFFDNEEKLPMYEWGLGRCKNIQEAANILLIEVTSANIAEVVPVNVNKNVSFIIDTLEIDNIEDLKCDELGSWVCMGVKSARFRKKSAKVRKVSEKKRNREDVFKVTSRYYSNGSLPSLKRIIVTGLDFNQQSYRYAFVQYIFTEGEQTVKGKLHGNSKGTSRPYKRTMKSTVMKIKTEVEKVDPRKVIHLLVEDRSVIDSFQGTVSKYTMRFKVWVGRITCQIP